MSTDRLTALPKHIDSIRRVAYARPDPTAIVSDPRAGTIFGVSVAGGGGVYPAPPRGGAFIETVLPGGYLAGRSRHFSHYTVMASTSQETKPWGESYGLTPAEALASAQAQQDRLSAMCRAMFDLTGSAATLEAPYLWIEGEPVS